MFKRFTERARQVIVLALDEARALKHDSIGTEHLLLGLLREDEGLAARVLDSLDITTEVVRVRVIRSVGEGEEVTEGQLPFRPEAKRVLELALAEALSLGHNYIGTEHLLIGLVREKQGVAARILLDLDADAEKVRNEIIRMLSGPGRRPDVGAETLARTPQELLETLASLKEAAIERQDFQGAAGIRDVERKLVDAMRRALAFVREEEQRQ